MTSQLYAPGREGYLLGEIDFDTATVKVSLIRGYTFSSAHKFVSDATGAGATLVATQTLTGKAGTSGVATAATPVTFPTVASGAACPALLFYQASAVSGGADVAASAQRLIAYVDGIFTVTCAVAASTSATSVTVDPLTAALVSGSTVTFGAVTATLTSAASAGARTLAVSALSGGISQGTVGTTSAQGNLPITPNGGDVNYAISSNIFTL